MDVYIGFDSAWADNPKAPGAIAAAQVENGQPRHFYEPRLVTFAGALQFINDVRSPNGFTLLALDQPTIVPNETSMRPVERTAASLVSWIGGGVQPSNRSKVGMFCAASPIWAFLSALNAIEDPERARDAVTGFHLIEVFPALALPSLDETFCGRLAGPRYNPERRKTFKLDDWKRVCIASAGAFEMLDFAEEASWCRQIENLATPRKSDQDQLDSMLCLLIGLSWRLKPRTGSLMLGCLDGGYMILPASRLVRERLTAAARNNRVPVDGVIPH